jgi:hypothetical protein
VGRFRADRPATLTTACDSVSRRARTIRREIRKGARIGAPHSNDRLAAPRRPRSFDRARLRSRGSPDHSSCGGPRDSGSVGEPPPRLATTARFVYALHPTGARSEGASGSAPRAPPPSCPSCGAPPRPSERSQTALRGRPDGGTSPRRSHGHLSIDRLHGPESPR